jgi:hypothetical protein
LALSWTDVAEQSRRASADGLGVDPELLPQLAHWLETQMDRGEWIWPRWFASLPVAQEFAQRFCSPLDGTVVLGLGVTDATADQLLADHPESPSETTPSAGIVEQVRHRLPLAAGGDVLGWELLGDMWGDFHSWLCNDLEPILRDRLGVRVNRRGLIDDLDTAAAAAGYLNTHADTGAEAVPWFPALLVAYAVDLGAHRQA